VPVISAPQAPEAAEAIARAAEAVGSPLRIVGCAPVQDGVMLPVRLLGAHQRINAAVAVGMAEVLAAAGEPITPEAIRQGLATVQWPGRLQVLREDPLLILDGAHDPAAVVALLAALKAHFPDRPRRYVLGFSREKDWPAMLRALAPTATEIIVTAADNPRAVPPEVAAAELPGAYTAGTIPKAIELARARAHPGDLICVTGSLYVVGEALAWWGEGR
jgi:dihydrofolate synthase/folylpolyglutamate synthase